MTTETNDIRPLENAEADHVAGGLSRRPPMLTTLAIGEEDGGWATTMAIGEEDGGRRSPRHLDAKFHLRQGA